MHEVFSLASEFCKLHLHCPCGAFGLGVYKVAESVSQHVVIGLIKQWTLFPVSQTSLSYSCPRSVLVGPESSHTTASTPSRQSSRGKPLLWRRGHLLGGRLFMLDIYY